MASRQKTTLRPTVKRDISLLTVEAWQEGYRRYMPQKLDWDYPILFWYDGQRVNFYHTTTDFQHFKEAITRRLIEDDSLFEQLNSQFQIDCHELISLRGQISARTILRSFELQGKIMAFYVFVVSDTFVTARPAAWASRHLSEGILYEFDEAIEQFISPLCLEIGLPAQAAHVMTLREIRSLLNHAPLDLNQIKNRIEGYILTDNALIATNDFTTYCDEHFLDNPEFSVPKTSTTTVRGQTAMTGYARGVVRIVHTKNDMAKVQTGDILVSPMTSVSYMPAILRAAAMITDEGGITCHAAIIARELHKPCITGTGNATQALTDGELIEIDATTGAIRRLV